MGLLDRIIQKINQQPSNDSNPGTPGGRGPVGPQGPPGPEGPVGIKRWYGQGPPTVVVGSQPGDEYLDTLTGNLYVLK